MSIKPKSSEQTHSQEITLELAKLSEKVDALSSLMEVSIIINSTLDLDELMELVMEKACSVMKAEAAAVMMINEEKNVLLCPVALGKAGEKLKTIELPIDKGIAGWVVAHGESQIIPDAYQDPRFNPAVDKETGFRTRSILAAPLKVKHKITGVAEVINRLDGELFTKEDLDLFSTFCRQVALAIENARIHHLEVERQKIEQQLEAAKFIQQSFMPGSFPGTPGQQFEVAASSQAAASVGGDFYDYMEFNNATFGFTLGDVSGKGIPAALFMARMVSDFRTFAQVHHIPSRVLAALNETLVERSQRGMFVTALYGVLHEATGDFLFANAGHLPLIKVRGKDGVSELLDGGKGIPLGISKDFVFQEQTTSLNSGDALVIISDGVIEAKGKSGQPYSLNRVREVLADQKQTARQILDTLLNDITQFTRGAVQHDDLTIVVIKWK